MHMDVEVSNRIKKVKEEGISINIAMKRGVIINEPQRDKTNKMTYVPSEYSDQPGHPPGPIRVFAVRFMGS